MSRLCPSRNFYLIFLALFVLFGLVRSDLWEDWDAILQTHVKEDQEVNGIKTSTINYTAVGTDDRFPAFLKALATLDNSTIRTKEDFIATYANGYNALVIGLVVAEPCRSDPFGDCAGPLTSIIDIGNLFDKVWKKPAGTIAGQNFSLWELKNLLRNDTGEDNHFGFDWRVHGILSCAAASCPDLWEHAFLPSTINQVLDDRLSAFLANPAKGSVLSGDQLRLNPIFTLYYPTDFSDQNHTIVQRLTPYFPANIRDFVTKNNKTKAYSLSPFVWDLNGPLQHQCDTRTCFPLWALIVTCLGVGIMFVLIVVVGLVFFNRRKTQSQEQGYLPVNS